MKIEKLVHLQIEIFTFQYNTYVLSIHLEYGLSDQCTTEDKYCIWMSAEWTK